MLARVFRNGERTGLHHPEFTMLEWYRARETYDALMADCAELLGADRAGRRGARVPVSRTSRPIRWPSWNV